MTSDWRVLWIVFALNLAWLLLLPTASGKIVALLGIVTVLVLRWKGPRARRGHAWIWPALFASPAISLLATPTLAFWRLDGRAWLIFAWTGWLASRCVEDDAERPGHQQSNVLPVHLFAFWTSLLWLTVVFDIGISNVIMHLDRAVTGPCRVDWLTTMASTWESEPASQHVFLAWRSAEAFAQRSVYQNHVHPYLVSMYGWIFLVRKLTGVPTFVASNSTMIPVMAVVIVAFMFLLQRSGAVARCRNASGVLTLFVALGFVITTWRFWNDLHRFNSDNPYPLLAALFVIVYACLLTPAMPRASLAASAVFVAMSPIHMPMLVLALVCLFGLPGRSLKEFVHRNRFVLTLSAWSAVVAVSVMVIPWTLVALKGYHPLSSTFLFRSGLDGDTRMFHDIFQAFWSASPINVCGTPRPFASLALPAFLPLIVFAWPVSRSDDAARLGGLVRLTLFLATPYLVSLIFFPQSVSVHPYLYDHLLVVPAVITGAALMTTASVRSRLAGPGLLAFLLFTTGLIMTNLIAIAQGIARVP